MRLTLPTVMLIAPLAVSCARIQPMAPLSTTLVVTPRLVEGSRIQAVVPTNTVLSIARLDLRAEVQTGPGVFAPISAVTGQPTTPSDPNLVKKSLVAPIIFNTPTVLGNLRANTTYRVVARAFDSGNNLISTDDALCAATVVVTNNNQPILAASLPVKLVDTLFSGQVSVTVALLGSPFQASASLVLNDLTNGGQKALYHGITQANEPKTVTVSNLRANTNYQLLATSYDASNHQVSTASTTVTVINDNALAAQTINVPAAKSDFVTGLRNPCGVAVDQNGNVYVANQDGGVVTKYHSAGNAGFTFSHNDLGGPRGVAVDATGDVYVANDRNSGDNVMVFSGTGALVRTLTGLNSPQGVAVDARGNVYVADAGNDRVVKYAAGDSSVTETLVTTSNGSPEGVAVDRAGVVYFTETANHKVSKVIGSTVTVIASAGFSNPAGLAVDAFGNLFVADRGNDRIAKITPAGTVLTTANGFNSPQAIAEAPSGLIYLTETGNNSRNDRVIKVR